MPRYQLVHTVEGRLISETFDDLAAIEIRYGAPVAYTTRRGLRQELIGQPVFGALYGPMWGGHDAEGEPIVRYEDSGANDRLSA